MFRAITFDEVRGGLKLAVVGLSLDSSRNGSSCLGRGCSSGLDGVGVSGMAC